MSSKDCEHKWNFQHVVYWSSRYPRPGSGAHDRIYADKYYCEKCLETSVQNERVFGNTYDNPLEGAYPK